MLPEVFRKLAPQGTMPSRLPTELQVYIPTATVQGQRPEFAPEQIVVKKEESKSYWLLATLGVALGAILLSWLWGYRQSLQNAAFDAAEQARLAQAKALAALSSLGTGFTAQDLATALNMNVISFESGSAQIPTQSFDFLNKAAEALKAAPSGTILEVAGHTDSVGSEASNMDLSLQRSNAVRDYLISQGVDPQELEATGYGQSRPIATNDTTEGRFRNRRIEFTVRQ
jgi:outer membrane protein OmpA-like peptidoglycan-associated protein